MNDVNNIFENIPGHLPEELMETLVQDPGIRIERIVSRGHFSPPGDWYDQTDNEFVILIKGSAGLRFEDREDLVVMKPGDWIDIPAHQRHRVEWTDPNQDTIWLAIHYSPLH